jgi:2-Cys peroxiredoxin 5
MSAWGSSLTKQFGDNPIRWLADPAGKFTRALGLEFESAAMLGTNRSKRYAIVVKGGKVEKVEVEPDNVGAEVSVAEKILG